MKRINTGNTAGILELVWMNEGISRIDLAKRLDIDKSTVSHLVGDLLARGLLEEYEQAEASSLGGRKPVKLRLRKDFGFLVGLEVQPDFYRAVVINLKGETVHTLTAEAVTNAAGFVSRVNAVLAELGREARYLDSCLGFGVAVSGIVDPFEGLVVESTNLGMRSVRLLPTLSQGREFPVYLENDANAACWGEVVQNQSLHHDLRSFLFCLVEVHKRSSYIPSGVSVGLGFVVNGRIHYGENFSAGEFRSLGWKPGHTFQFSLNDAEMGRFADDAAVQRRFFGELADHLLFLSRVFNLNRLFFGGEIEPYRRELASALDEARLRAWPEGDCPCQVGFSTHGSDAVAFGAACLGLTNFFRHPEFSARLET
jgi:predicted NBD/HSP70 family sugar kinase